MVITHTWLAALSIWLYRSRRVPTAVPETTVITCDLCAFRCSHACDPNHEPISTRYCRGHYVWYSEESNALKYRTAQRHYASSFYVIRNSTLIFPLNVYLCSWSPDLSWWADDSQRRSRGGSDYSSLDSSTAATSLFPECLRRQRDSALNEENEWDMVKIIGKRRTRSDYEYKVHWEDTWVPRSELENAQELL